MELGMKIKVKIVITLLCLLVFPIIGWSQAVLGVLTSSYGYCSDIASNLISESGTIRSYQRNFSNAAGVLVVTYDRRSSNTLSSSYSTLSGLESDLKTHQTYLDLLMFAQSEPILHCYHVYIYTFDKYKRLKEYHHSEMQP
jgi:hypothetical protein